MTAAARIAPAAGERQAVNGRLGLAFAADQDGRSFIRQQYAAYPFHICRALYMDRDAPGLATLYVQSCSGGLYENDRHAIDVTAEPGAAFHLTTQASTIVHSMERGQAEQDVTIDAGDDAFVEYLPDPQILFPLAQFRSAIRVRASARATVVLSDAVLCHDPIGKGAPSLFRSEIAVEDQAGRLLAIDRLRLDRAAFVAPRPGVLGRYAVNGTLMIVTRDQGAAAIQAAVRAMSIDRTEAAVGVSELPHAAGYVCRILAADGVSLKRTMFEVWSIARQALRGHRPAARRK